MSEEPGTTVSGQGDLIDQLQRLDSYEFEKLVAALWENKGYSTKVHDQSHDKGIDVTATRGKPGEKVLIQAKRFTEENKVGSDEVRRYATLYQQEDDADGVVLATTSTFTRQARSLADDLDVETVDKHGILEQLSDEPELVRKYVLPFSQGEEEVAAAVRLQNKVVLGLKDVTSRWREVFDQLARELKLWNIAREVFGLGLYPPRKRGLEEYIELRRLVDSRIQGIEAVVSTTESLGHTSIENEELVITEGDLGRRVELLLELQELLEELLETGDRIVSKAFIDSENPFEGDIDGVQSFSLKSDLESPPDEAHGTVEDCFEKIGEKAEEFSTTYEMPDNAEFRENVRKQLLQDE